MFLALISTFSSLIAAEPEPRDSVVLYAYWNNHETKKYEILIHNEKYNEDGSTQIDSVWSLNQMEVIDSTAETYTIKWTTLEQKFAGSDTYKFLENNQSLVPKNVSLIYEITTVGNFIRIVNIQEIKNLYLTLLDSAANALFNAEQKETARKALEPFTNEDYIRQIYSSVFELTHQFYGYQYALDNEYEYAAAMPNYLNGQSMPAAGRLYVSEIDTNYNAIEFVDTQEPDSIALKASVASYIRSLLENEDEADLTNFDKSIEELNIRLIDERSFNYDIYSGWMNYFYHVRDVYANGRLSNRMINYIQLL